MSLPRIGAAMLVDEIATHRDWLIDGQRDLELQSFHSAEILEGNWRPLVDKTLKLLDGYAGRLGIHGPYIGLMVGSPDPGIQQVVAERFTKALDVCAALGATQMVIHSPFIEWDHHNFCNFRGSRERIFEATHATLDAVVKRAEDQGVCLVLENIWDIDPEERLRLVESFGSTAFKLSVDVGHAHIAHTGNGAIPADYFIQSAANTLAHVHLQDNDGYSDRHWSVGEGTIRWPAIFRALSEIDSRPHLVLELIDRSKIPASMRFLKELGLAD